MGKFPLADEALTRVVICRKCKTRNKVGREKCRKCGSHYLRPKHKELRVKK
jgi:ribosomal protein L40E